MANEMEGILIGMLIGILAIYGVPTGIGRITNADDDGVLALHGVMAGLVLMAVIIMLPTGC